MAPAAVPGRLSWALGTVVRAHAETPTARTLAFDCPDWPGHRAGQHVDVRLTAEDGYEAQRSYSIASAPDDPVLELSVERLEDGEVSPYLADEVMMGDQLELRGPIGGHFTWSVDDGGPIFMVAGGSGVVPFRAMLRHRLAAGAAGAAVDARLLVSARDLDHLYYREELPALGDVHVTLTRSAPPDWAGEQGRVDAGMLERLGPDPALDPRAFVCGPTPFVEGVATALVDLGHDPARVHTERFGAYTR